MSSPAALHHLLLRVAGWAPDDLVCAARGWLAEGRRVDLAQAVCFAALGGRLPLTAADHELLLTTLSDAGVDPGPLDELEPAEPGTDGAPAGMPPFAMAPLPPGRPGEDVPDSLDLAGTDDLDDLDRAAVAAATDPPVGITVHALWRAWRYPAVTSPWPAPRRIYLAQAGTDAQAGPDDTRLPELTGRLQRALSAAGEVHPQVEVFVDPADLPPYQRTALGLSALLWTAQPGRGITVARLFDPVDEVGGPGFSAAHPTLADPERDAVLAYLDAGSPLLTTTALMDDVVDPDGHGVVPMGQRTDGRWVWSEAVAYYLRHHGLAPEDGLLHHIRTRGYAMGPVDVVARHRAMAALQAATADLGRLVN